MGREVCCIKNNFSIISDGIIWWYGGENMEYLVKIDGAHEFTIENVSLIVVKDESYFVYDGENNIILTTPQAKTSYIALKK